MQHSLFSLKDRGFIGVGATTGAFLGIIYSILEYSLSARPLLILLILGGCVGLLIGVSVALFETSFGKIFRQRSFISTVFIRTLIYLCIILFWLFIINTINNVIIWETTVTEGIFLYVNNDSFIYNLTFAFSGILIMTTFYQISKLHRKGELASYILGRYNNPREVEQIFLFVDLKSSTQIAEKIGNLAYGKFLQDYYADITTAIKKTSAIVYQYVGDEIVLTWPTAKGIYKNRCVEFIGEMKNTFSSLSEKYENLYGFSPEFRAGLHGGKVLITWIGEVKKEIVYVGDVLNTTARIAEECKKQTAIF